MRLTPCLCVVSMALVFGCTVEEDATPPPCVPDTNEPNDSVTEATSLGALQDDGELDTPGQVPNKVTKAFSTHTASDVDWYTVDVRDTGVFGNPKINVIVGRGHEATAFWSCTNGPTESVDCLPGTAVTDDPDLPSTRGCVTVEQAAGGSASASLPLTLQMQVECSGTPTDSGKLQIRVKRTAPADTCERYTLTVDIE